MIEPFKPTKEEMEHSVDMMERLRKSIEAQPDQCLCWMCQVGQFLPTGKCQFCGEPNQKIHFCKNTGLNLQDPDEFMKKVINLFKEKLCSHTKKQ